MPLNVCLIKPPTCTSASSVGNDAVPPIGLAYLAASARAAGHRVVAIDAVGEALDQYTRFPGHEMMLVHGLLPHQIVERIPRDVAVIGVSVMFSLEWLNSRRTIEAIRAAFPRVPIVAGGEHITAMTEHALRDCPAIDFCAQGEGEDTLRQLLGLLAEGRSRADIARECPGIVALDGGRLVKGPPRARIRDVDAIPDPAWNLLPIERYIDGRFNHGVDVGRRSMPILASRGCPYDCTFCSSPQMWTTRWNTRSPEHVLAEIERHVARYGTTNFDFYDLTAIVDKRWTVRFAQLIVERNLDITWQLPTGTRSEALDEEVLPLLHQAGCRHVIYAPESGSPRILKMIRKKVKVPRMLRSMRTAVGLGMGVKANIVIGFPGENKRDLPATWRFVQAMALAGVDDVSVFVYSPYPGSAIFRELQEAGRLTIDDAYFAKLVGHSNPWVARSFCDDMSDIFVRLCSLAMMASFYATSFALRPWRLVRTALNLLRGRPGTRLEVSLNNLFRKLTRLKSAAPDPHPVSPPGAARLGAARSRQTA